eukprot:TRINITY_DN978_c0_g3_i1.p1 TRINITY_DN978_c0_g3~~TRINITY_DN978_c0_g3_i1.p1  ORF type:complete len:519 (+),score=122.18 TRINITY_DN978_c0_g3_i1:174-1730(+)
MKRWIRARKQRSNDKSIIDLSSSAKESWDLQGKSGLKCEDIPRLVDQMRESFLSGVSRSIDKRLEQLEALRLLLDENEEQILMALALDLGKPRMEALAYDILWTKKEVVGLIKNLRKYLEPQSVGFNIMTFPSKQRMEYEPYGVTLVIGTWNFPLLLSLNPLAGAIACGNTCVLKPSNVTPNCSALIEELVHKYMDGSIVTVVGPGENGDRNMIKSLLNEKFEKIFFTGSPSVGKIVMRAAAENLASVTLELGGKNPVFVDSGADLKVAARRIVLGRMLNAGQQCIAPDLVLCHEDVLDEFISGCTKQVVLQFPDPKTCGNFARIVGRKQFERVKGLLEQVEASEEGKIICGVSPSKLVNSENDNFIPPTIVTLPLDSKCRIMEEETFGPVLTILSVKNMHEAIKFFSSRPKPLSMYIFSKNERTIDQITRNTSAGGVAINCCLLHAAHPGLIFGGVGLSGQSGYHGIHTIEAFSHKKPILEKTTIADPFGVINDPDFVYPPYNSSKEKKWRTLMKRS